MGKDLLSIRPFVLVYLQQALKEIIELRGVIFNELEGVAEAVRQPADSQFIEDAAQGSDITGVRALELLFVV